MTASSDARNKRAVLAIGALGLIVLVWYLRGSDDKRPRGTPGASSVGSVAQNGSAGTPGGGPMMSPTVKGSAIPLPPMVLGGADQVREALAQYLIFSEYPAWSRPADGSQEHLWKWNQLDPVGQAFANDGKGKKISAQLELDKLYADAGESITATVTVWRGTYEDAAKEPVDAKVVGYIEAWRNAATPTGATPSPSGSASVIAIPKPGEAPAAGTEGYFPVETVSFTSVAGGPGHRYVAKFTPSAIAALKTQSDVRFLASVDPNGHPFPFSQPFRYAAVTPLVVLDRHTDAIVKGSLEVTLALDVKILGPVMVQATLFDASGTTPIAVYDDYYRPAQLGLQEVKITFFGKAINAKGVDGPYSIRSLHGFVRVEGEPPELFYESKSVFTTGAYKATDFSASEWDSPEKQAKIDQYKQMLNMFENK